eukprot:TRINITY_DN627_c0_g1_i3.p1 TRINITY_DN627_c0_g1~~TRINITY_DN627_c0_g1_i3.p1  ORF type:complete len:592 (+),score=226.15 TRINITY_DN627_c0_g1_i3:50-1777(+)
MNDSSGLYHSQQQQRYGQQLQQMQKLVVESVNLDDTSVSQPFSTSNQTATSTNDYRNSLYSNTNASAAIPTNSQQQQQQQQQQLASSARMNDSSGLYHSQQQQRYGQQLQQMQKLVVESVGKANNLMESIGSQQEDETHYQDEEEPPRKKMRLDALADLIHDKGEELFMDETPPQPKAPPTPRKPDIRVFTAAFTDYDLPYGNEWISDSSISTLMDKKCKLDKNQLDQIQLPGLRTPSLPILSRKSSLPKVELKATSINSPLPVSDVLTLTPSRADDICMKNHASVLSTYKLSVPASQITPSIMSAKSKTHPEDEMETLPSAPESTEASDNEDNINVTAVDELAGVNAMVEVSAESVITDDKNGDESVKKEIVEDCSENTKENENENNNNNNNSNDNKAICSESKSNEENTERKQDKRQEKVINFHNKDEYEDLSSIELDVSKPQPQIYSSGCTILPDEKHTSSIDVCWLKDTDLSASYLKKCDSLVIQCQNPACAKWRIVPRDLNEDGGLDKKFGGINPFYCVSMFWNPQQASCDSPEMEYATMVPRKIHWTEDHERSANDQIEHLNNQMMKGK